MNAVGVGDARYLHHMTSNRITKEEREKERV